MPNRQENIDIINNALQYDNKKVIVLKGDWGIGKTYLWKQMKQIAEQNDKHSIFNNSMVIFKQNESKKRI